ANPVILKKGIEFATDFVVKMLIEKSKPLENNDIFKVAKISAGDEKIAELITLALARVGNDGVITIEEGNSTISELHLVKGMQLDRGYSSPRKLKGNSGNGAYLYRLSRQGASRGNRHFFGRSLRCGKRCGVRHLGRGAYVFGQNNKRLLSHLLP
ncbi:MAG: hypothetical protein II377_06435, partial [Clostridia bacterium]|nr:hypothetical protein [Clostridia bacterium]